MFGLIRTAQRLPLARQRLMGQPRPLWVRSMFSWRGKGDDDGNDNNNRDKNDDNNNNDDGHNNGDDNKPRPSVEVVDNSNAVSRIGVLDDAPKPPNVLALPISRRVLFPGFLMPLSITDEQLIDALTKQHQQRDNLTAGSYVGTFMLKDQDADPMSTDFQLTSASQVHDIGTLAQIQHIAPFGEGVQVILLGHRRIRQTGPLSRNVYPLRLNIEHIDRPRQTPSNDRIKAYGKAILDTCRELVRMNPMFREHLSYFSQRLDVQDPYRLVSFKSCLHC